MAVELKHVTYQVGADTHIYSTDLKLEPGGFHVLLGTTLAGKTTLLRLMAGLEKPSRGEIWFNGHNVTGTPVQKRSVSMVYQQFIIYANFTVFDNIASPLRVARTSSADIKTQVGQMAELLQLTPMLHRFPHELSGGQQQRTALARALVKQSELVLLDEPLANLDYKLREELRDELPALFAGTGASVVYATTEPVEALLLGGYTAALHEGQVVQYGASSSVYRDPRNLLSAQVFSDPPMNTALVTKTGSQVELTQAVSWAPHGGAADLRDGPYILGIRPQHLGLTPADDHAVNVSGTVVISEISGSESVIHVDVNGQTWVSQLPGIHPFEVGDRVELYLQSDRCFYFDPSRQLRAGA